MKITPNGIQLNGEAMVLDTLLTSQISSKPGRSLTIDSSRNITLTARDDQGRIANKLFLGESGFWCILILFSTILDAAKVSSLLN